MSLQQQERSTAPSDPAASRGHDRRFRLPRAVKRLRRYVVPAVLLAVLALLIIYPIGILAYASFIDAAPRPGHFPASWTLDSYRGLASGTNLKALRNSAIVGVSATAMAVLCGTVLAWLVTRTNVPGRRMIQIAGVGPIFISALVGALSWSLLASPRAGYANMALTELGIPITVNIYSLGGIAFVLGLYYTPYVYLFVQGPLSTMNPELEQAAAVHGANRRQIARQITIPLALPAILTAASLSLVLILENFPVPQILGSGEGGTALIPSQIFRLMMAAPSRPNDASAMGMMLLVLMVALVLGQRLVMRNKDYATLTGKGFRPEPTDIGRWRWPGFAFGFTFLMLAVVLPLFALVQTAMRHSLFVDRFASLFDPRELGFDGFFDVLGMNSFSLSVRNTVIVGVATALVGGVFHVVLAYAVERSDVPGRRLLNIIAMTPAAVPALVVGLGFLWAWLLLPVPIYGTLIILVLAYIARFTPQGFGAVSSSMGQVHMDLENAARVSGANRTRAVSSVTLPLIRPGIASMVLLLLVLSMRELSSSIFLFTSRTRVMSVLLYEQWQGASLSRVAWISLLYTGALFVVTLLGRRSLQPVTAPNSSQ